MSEEKIKIKDYSSFSTRILNKRIRLRERQILAATNGHSNTNKTLAQLQYELNAMTTTLMERVMTKNDKVR